LSRLALKSLKILIILLRYASIKILWIYDGEVEIMEALDLWGKGVQETDAIIKERLEVKTLSSPL